jgi:hypothetical protein
MTAGYRRKALAPSVGADAVALFAVLATAPGRTAYGVPLDTASAATGQNRYRLAVALGQLEDAGCLPGLVISPSMLMYTACAGAACVRCFVRAAA